MSSLSKHIKAAWSQSGQKSSDGERAKAALQIVQRLATGKLDKRFLEALRLAPQKLYQDCYPRKFRDVPGYHSPKHFLPLAVISEFLMTDPNSKDAVRLTVGYERSPMVRQFVEGGCPTYWLRPDLTKALLETDYEDVTICGSDFEWPHQTFLVMVPKTAFQNAPVLLVIGNDTESVHVAAIYENPRFPGHEKRELGASNYLDFLDFPMTAPIGPTLSKLASSKPDPHTSKLAINTLLAMVAEPPAPAGRRKSEGGGQTEPPKKPGELWEPNFLNLSAGPSGDTEPGPLWGTQKRPHARRGHWRSRWVKSDLQEPLSRGKKVLLQTDLRKVAIVEDFSERHVVVSWNGSQETFHPTEVIQASAKFVWVRKSMVGLKKRPSQTTREFD